MPHIAVAVAVAFKAAAVAVIGTSAVATAVTGAITGGIMALGGAAGLGSFITAWSTVASIASMAMQPKVSAGQSGGPVSIKLDPDAGVPVIFGETISGGNVVYRATWGGDATKWLGVMTVHSAGGPIEDIGPLYVRDELVSFAGSPANAVGAYADHLYQYTKVGAVPETAFDILHTAHGGDELPEWTSAHKLSGLATALTVHRWRPRIYPQGLPKMYRIPKGVKCYDPRLDTTYPGGSGAHRSATSSTWAWSENPYICALAWLMGRFENGKKVWGCGVPIANIDVAAFVTGANVADANGWTVGGIVYTNDDKFEVLAALLQAGGGLPVSRGASISCMINTPQTSVFNVTAADVAGQVQIVGTLPRRARFNRVIPKYRSFAHHGQIVAALAVSQAAYVTADGGETRTRESNLPLVQDVDQAAQLAGYDLANTREGLVFTIPCKPSMLNARVGDCGTVQLPELGYASQKCVVIGREFDPDSFIVTLTMRSETDAKHAWALALAGTPPPDPVLDPGDGTIAAPGASAWTATGGTIGTGGAIWPAVIVTGAVDNDNAQWIVVEYKKAADSIWSTWGAFPRDQVRFEIAPLQSATSYDTRISYISAGGVPGNPTTEAAVTTGAAVTEPPTTYEPPLPPGYTPETPNSSWVDGPNPDVIAF